MPKLLRLPSCLIPGIGSGGSYASAAARALIDLPDWDAEAIGECRTRVNCVFLDIVMFD